MAAYFIIDIKVHDEPTYHLYIDKVKPIIEQYGGRYLARGGAISSFTGQWNPERIILIEFPSAADVKRCLASDAYKAIAPLRERSTSSQAIVVEGIS